MELFCGIDGGGTKTHCIIGNEKMQILAEGFGGPANYHTVGLNRTRKSIEESLQIALKKSNLKLKNLKFTILGLSGADREEDVKILTNLCEKIFGSNKSQVLNDCWIALRNGSPENWGIVAICGTGGGYAGRNKKGESFIYRNLDYLTGGGGGGLEIAEKAIHFAFRSEEGSYVKSILESAIPELFNVKEMKDVLSLIWQKNIEKKILDKIPPLVIKLAQEGDEVCNKILQELGQTIGQYINGIIKKLFSPNEKIPIILSGGVFKSKNSPLISSIEREVIKNYNLVNFVIPDTPPVYGAYYLAISLL